MQAKAINKALGISKYPTLIVGDLNDGPESETLKILSQYFYKPRIPTAEHNTWPANDPKVCLDHILFNMPKQWQIIDYEIVCEYYASDHFIVIATLVFIP